MFTVIPLNVEDPTPPNGEFVPPLETETEKEIRDVGKFASESEFENYLSQAMEMVDDYYRVGTITRELTAPLPEMDISMPAPIAQEAAPERYSETNIQVEGVDEPDIVKTDGINIYASIEAPYYRIMPEPMPVPMLEAEDLSEEAVFPEISRDYVMPPRQRESETKIIKAFPVDDLELTSKIDRAGNLLLKDDTLVIFGRDRIFGYDIKERENPQEKWEIELDSRTQFAGARAYKDTIYLITSSRVQSHRPCIIEPLIINGKPLEISCTEIYHPRAIIPADTTYSVVAVDMESGEAQNNISFIGSAQNSVIYVSLENIYLSYYRQKPVYEFMTDFFRVECKDLVPEDVLTRLYKLEEYDISSRAKMVEFEVIIEEWMNSLDEDEKMRVETELTNRMPDYYERNMRKLEITGIVKIGTEDLEIRATGSVPGHLLNQFAMDEHEGNLRVATTIGERSRFRTFVPRRTGFITANDVYVLDESLEQIGSVKDLGLEERIYSARFLGDMGYVVTFREIDPFYVLDLSDPYNPEMKGELKIPGYSSYLHPISEDLILGIGREDWNVKASLFDVSDPYDPREIDKYFIDESWSEILNNHHAFLLDSKHEIFFLPGRKGAYIFSFAGNKISLERTVKETQVKRALYIDDYLYIIGAEKVVVLDQQTWERVKELDLR